MQEMLRAFSLAMPRAGRSIAARMEMMAITTNNSISVKAERTVPDPEQEGAGADRKRNKEEAPASIGPFCGKRASAQSCLTEVRRRRCDFKFRAIISILTASLAECGPRQRDFGKQLITSFSRLAQFVLSLRGICNFVALAVF